MRAKILRHVASVARKEHIDRQSGIAKEVTHDAPKGVSERQVASYELIEKKQATIEGEQDAAEVVEEEKLFDFAAQFTGEDYAAKTMQLNKYRRFNWFVEVLTLTSGHSFGELALINNAPRQATIKTLSKCSFVTISRKDYSRVLEKLEAKAIEQRVLFFKQMPFLKHWTKT